MDRYVNEQPASVLRMVRRAMLGDWRIQGLSVDSTARASCRRSSSPKASAALQSRRQPFFLQSSGGVLQHSDGVDDQLVGVTPHNISGDALSAMCCSLAICLTETRSGQGSGCRIQPEQRRLPCAVWARAFRHSKTTSRPLEMLLTAACSTVPRRTLRRKLRCLAIGPVHLPPLGYYFRGADAP